MPIKFPGSALVWAEFQRDTHRVGLKFACGEYTEYDGLNVLAVRAALRQLDETGKNVVRVAVANVGARVRVA